VKYAELHLPLIGQGAQLAVHLNKQGTTFDALQGYLKDLQESAMKVRRLLDEFEGSPLELSTTDQTIIVLGEEHRIDYLIREDVLTNVWEEIDV
jgi:hypothetical protein